MSAKVHQKLVAWLCGGSLGIISVAGMLPEDADGRQTGVFGVTCSTGVGTTGTVSVVMTMHQIPCTSIVSIVVLRPRRPRGLGRKSEVRSPVEDAGRFA